MGSPYGWWTCDPTCRVLKGASVETVDVLPRCMVWEEVTINTVDV